MGKIVMKSIFKIVVVLSFIVIVKPGFAESTVILNLQEKLNQQYQEFNKQSNKIKAIRNSDTRAKTNYWHQKSQSLPRDSNDYNYAIAKFVNERVKMIEPEIESVIELEQLTLGLEKTVSQLRKAISKTANHHQQISKNLSPEFYFETTRQILGMGKIMSVLMKDPLISRNPTKVNVINLGKSLGKKLKSIRNSKGRQDPVNHLIMMEDYLESQSEVISLIREDYEEDYNNLQTLSLSKDISMSAKQVNSMFANLNGLYNDVNVQQARSQTIELLDQVQEDWGQSSVNANEMSQDWDAYGKDMEEFFSQEPVY